MINDQAEIYRKLGLHESQDMPGKRKKRVNRSGGGPMSMSDVLSNQPRPSITLPEQMQEGSQQGQDQKPGYAKGGAPKKVVRQKHLFGGLLSSVGHIVGKIQRDPAGFNNQLKNVSRTVQGLKDFNAS